MLAMGGIFMQIRLYSVTIAAYVALYVLQNLRRPLCVSYISDRVHGRVMSVGLSVESLTKVILMAVLAPVFGYFADAAGVGFAILLAGSLMLVLYVPLRLAGAAKN